MKTYESLENFLLHHPDDAVAMTFDEIEHVIGAPLPASAHERNAWWSNNATGHSQAKAWMGAGFIATNVDRKCKVVVFRRVALRAVPPQDLGEEPAVFRREGEADFHPAFGAMKGTFTIEPGYDVTKPAYSDKEWAEIEGRMLGKFDRHRQ
jgi:hypothetical protein